MSMRSAARPGSDIYPEWQGSILCALASRYTIGSLLAQGNLPSMVNVLTVRPHVTSEITVLTDEDVVFAYTGFLATPDVVSGIGRTQTATLGGKLPWLDHAAAGRSGCFLNHMAFPKPPMQLATTHRVPMAGRWRYPDESAISAKRLKPATRV